MAALTNKRHERFARAIASGMPASTAYRRHIARSRDGRHIYENASHLKNRVCTRIEELRAKLDAAGEDSFILTKTELMIFLTRIIRSTPAEWEASIASVTLSPNNGVVAQAVSADLINLTPNTPYHYRLVATNTAGTSNGPDQVFTTPLADTDGDGIPDIYETGTGIYVSATNTGTSPLLSDTDGDGLTDGQEVYTILSNPNIADSDGDGFNDGFEVSTGFSPTSAASTPDTQSTILTAVEYRFNAALGVSYRIEVSTDLANWTTLETPLIGTGGSITRFYSVEGQQKRFFRSRRN